MVAAATDPIVVTKSNRVVQLTLNRSESMNALSEEIRLALENIIPELVKDKNVGCIVLTGSGPAFCAGGDIKGMTDRAPLAVRRRMQRTHAWAKQMVSAEKPIVAAVNGTCVGAGLSLALLCDVIVASSNATFRAAFAGIGVVPDAGIAFTLSRAIGLQRAKELLLCDQVVDAKRALAMGLVSAIVEPDRLSAEAMAIADKLANGPASLGLTKSLLNRSFECGIEDFLEYEALLQTQAFATSDFEEGVLAFMQRRKPQFPHE